MPCLIGDEQTYSVCDCGVRGRVYLELAVEILSGGAGSESKISRMIKPVKDAKGGIAGGKDGKTPAGGGGGGGAGGAAEEDKGRAAAPEVLPVESPPAVRTSCSDPRKYGEISDQCHIKMAFLKKKIRFKYKLVLYKRLLESLCLRRTSSVAVSESILEKNYSYIYIYVHPVSAEL